MYNIGNTGELSVEWNLEGLDCGLCQRKRFSWKEWRNYEDITQLSETQPMVNT